MFYALLAGALLMAVPGAALLGSGQPSFAQGSGWALLGQEVAITTEGWDETAPAIACNSQADEFLVVWQAGEPGNADEPDIYARRVSASGVPLGEPIAISTAPGPQVAPAVAYNPNANEYLVVWSDARNGYGARQDIYARRLTGDGSLVGPELRITNRDGNEKRPRVAYNPLDDLYVVVWEDTGGAAQDTGVLAQRLRGDGELEGQPYAVADEVWKDQVPDIAYVPVGNRFLVVWQYWRRQPLPTDYAIYARFLTGSGEVDGTSPVITVAFYEDSEQRLPAVAASQARDEQLILWQDSRLGASALSVYGARVVAGQLQDEFRLASDPPAQAPALAYDLRADAYLAAWQARVGDEYHVLVTAVDSMMTGQDEVLHVGDGTGEQRYPAVAYSAASDRFLVVWEEQRPGAGTGLDVYGQLVGQVPPPATATPMPTASSTASPIPSATATSSLTATFTPSPSLTPMATWTATEGSSPAPTFTPTASPSATASPTGTATRQPAVTITGRVQDCAGRPLAGAEVSLDGEWRTTADEEGRYTLGPIAGLRAGPHRLTAAAAGLAPQTVTVELPASGTLTFDFAGEYCLAEPQATPTPLRPHRIYLPLML